MTVTDTGRVDPAYDWTVSDRVPDQVAASCLYDSAGWLRGWERIGIEQRTRHAYVCADGDGGADVLPLYETTMSPFWHGYELQCDLSGRFGNPIVFAGSPYSMYGKRGPVTEPLVHGAYTTAMDWIRGGTAEVLVVPNLTSEGVDSWLDAVGPPAGTVHLERTYAIDVAGTFTDHLYRIDNKIRRDVERRLRRGEERGLRVRMVDGDEAHALVPAAFPLTVDTSDKNSWPALFDEAALHGMLDVPGALLSAATVGDRLVGVFFGFRRGDEVTFMCGGVDYHSLREYSTYIALMYRSTQWAYENGMRRIEWGRDNYRFKERHGLAATELWALVYAPNAGAELALALRGMHATLHAYIEGA
ncbi:GNAT family N-acetyltransferase [Actinophytocola glycyrrhizae]|uniref:GNAT family N-acetyltransferase n=1 Tax=Actinophytocola glycyrrhizae TaxID=2044873 RepID=A0ABV9RSF0_9PSEU